MFLIHCYYKAISHIKICEMALYWYLEKVIYILLLSVLKVNLNPLVHSVHYKERLTKILILGGILKKNFLLVSQLWVGRRKDLILSYVTKTTKKRLRAVMGLGVYVCVLQDFQASTITVFLYSVWYLEQWFDILTIYWSNCSIFSFNLYKIF